MKQFSTILELLDEFSDQKKCASYLESLVWNGGNPVCPHCGNADKSYRFKSRNIFKCCACTKQFSATTNTIFHGSPIELRKWFVAIYLFSTHKKGVSAHQLAKDIKVTVKTAWFMVHRIRYAIQTQDFGKPLEGTVTVDESFWGQKSKNMHYDKRPKFNTGRKGDKKITVFAMIDNNSRVKTVKVKNTSGAELKQKIEKYVAKNTTIQTDEWQAYNGLQYLGYNHIRCDHGKHQYVAENGANTNKCENYFSNMKRTFHGTYHKMTEKHIEKYLAETDFRFNTRNETEQGRFNLLLQGASVRLTYKALIQ